MVNGYNSAADCSTALKFGVCAIRVRGGCEIVEFVDWSIMDFVIKAQDDWRDVARPQVAMHHNATFCSLVIHTLSCVCV